MATYAGRTPTIRTFGEGAIKVQGLASFARELAKVADKYPERVREANYDAAQTIVVSAKNLASARGKGFAKAAKSLRSSKAVSYSSIRGGGPAYPYFYGYEFGGLRRTRSGKLWGGFSIWRGNQWGGWSGGPGYFLHPAIRGKGPQVIENYKRKLAELERIAFPE